MLRQIFPAEQNLVDRNIRALRDGIRHKIAHMRRSRLDGVVFIGVTGSCGKTTAASLLGAILAARGQVRLGAVNNCERALQITMRDTSRSDAWCVQEIGVDRPGSMALRAALFRPHIGIVTTIGLDHAAAYKNADSASLEGAIMDQIAAEKGHLVQSLPAAGVAVLNADDPRVLAMRNRTKARVLTYGRNEQADLRATEVSSVWPDRLSFTAHWDGKTATVRTRLVGEIWTASVLAALAGALAAGVPFDAAIASVERFEAVFGRNSIHAITNGPTFICGAAKAAYASIRTDISVLASARAPRKTLVLGNIADYLGAGGPKYRAIARVALAGGARVIGVGRNAASLGRLAPDHAPGSVAVFATVRQAHDYLVSTCVPDELVMLKSAGGAHLERIVLNWRSDSHCWVENCGL